MDNYDVVVIGAGPGGYVAAIRASQLGLNTAIIEKEWLGGVCLNVGCIPSKALLKNAEVAHILRKRGREFGFSFDNLVLDYSKAVKRSRQVSGRLTRGVGFLMKKNGIDVFMGTAKVTSSDKVAIAMNDGTQKVLQAKNIIIATGASPIAIPGVIVDGKKVLNYRDAITQDKLPESVVIIGSGAIGVEFATIWNAYGVDITIVEMLPRIVPLEDEEVGTELEKSFKKSKIQVLTGYKVENIETHGKKVQVRVNGVDGEQIIEAEQALMAIGFRPNVEGIGLENVGIKLNEFGAIEIDDTMATNIPGIWAIGDVTAKLMLAHVGSAQGMLCVDHIAGIQTSALNYDMMPRATYCQPQIASFGFTESQASEQGHDVKVGKFPFQANGKALGLGESTGWVKLITDAEDGEILGAHMIGPEVTELLPEVTIAQMMELTAAEIARNVHAHPTLSEALMEAAHSAEGHAIHL
ncbi:MAG: dihydrolipoyl dehydrogenase [Chloroflexi bacterium]|nr:dihydrolipoyl dehydrogenase [Chloroflexota bacterium]